MNLVLGVTGSIAAYKSASLVRLLIQEEVEVQVIMTKGACEFIPPLTLSTLSHKPVLSAFKNENTGDWNNHVHLANWADALLIAPASANTIAKMALGLCDNLLLAIYLSSTCQVFVAPAMDREMYAHPAIAHNLDILERRGVSVIPAEEGELASGIIGKGRMAEPDNILDILRPLLKK